jgi:hypothetical protein
MRTDRVLGPGSYETPDEREMAQYAKRVFRCNQVSKFKGGFGCAADRQKTNFQASALKSLAGDRLGPGMYDQLGHL